MTWFLIAWFLSGEKQAFLYLRNHRIQAVSHPVVVQGASAHKGRSQRLQTLFCLRSVSKNTVLIDSLAKASEVTRAHAYPAPYFLFSLQRVLDK